MSGGTRRNRELGGAHRPDHELKGGRDGSLRFDGSTTGIAVDDNGCFRIGCTEINVQAVINVYHMLKTAGRIG